MPSTGFYPFLQDSPSPKKSSKGSCQCPQRASIHFYGQKLAGYQYHLICVNALNGLLSISTEVVAVVDDYVLSVSMPSTGFYPFLLCPTLGELQTLKGMCQCPQRASIHFYRFMICSEFIGPRCVNALNGLLSISTVASRKP